MGAHARKQDEYRIGPESAPRAKTLGLTLMRPTTRASLMGSFFTPIPEEVLVLDEGIAVATYADDGAVQYGSLGDLLEDHGLDEDDLEVVDRVRGIGRWSR